MKNSDIQDPLFRKAVEAIDAGNISLLQQLLEANPELVTKRLDAPNEGYFKNPYLLWFVADNPIRHEKLPSNIVDITQTILKALQDNPGDNYQHQVDYALGLVCTGRIPKECGVQIPLMELLISNGARVKGSVLGPIGQHNFEAAKFLLAKGADYNLATAVGLDQVEDVKRLLKNVTASELYVALVVASFFGKADIISLLIQAGVDVNGHGERKDFGGFHGHASPLHQAVYSGSLESVRLLLEAGANLNATDKAYNGTPLGWAEYMQTEAGYTEEDRKKFAAIEDFLRTHSAS
ncbi:MAG TPA: ankyrin repeat domain-containing protein [Parafilimonas sp.]|nr:ankyrin repeat domain-containing protein [Parafilimonas sp.]